jgi:hypothetical protein
MVQEEFGVDLEEASEPNRWVVVGDSPNDAPMFGYFNHSVGLAKLLDFADQLDAFPRYLTQARWRRVCSTGTGIAGRVVLTTRTSQR